MTRAKGSLTDELVIDHWWNLLNKRNRRTFQNLAEQPEEVVFMIKDVTQHSLAMSRTHISGLFSCCLGCPRSSPMYIFFLVALVQVPSVRFFLASFSNTRCIHSFLTSTSLFQIVGRSSFSRYLAFATY